ncbi:methylamine utilization protein MauE [Chthoniobacter flavus]|uniref:MauE/DoxX family redox-associated membrane protein n=1 Tax=Chthoniobacter flavus TaxID=191863 RepID=UPI0010433F7F|nr:MauE/DoxX family redox-associated membrane protein [Chthoniobacter flavus]TCO94542.1 methylamine utilization protein MauE [Chthoniobacter flavus]
MVGKIIVLLLRLAVAAVFLYAGVMKIWDFRHGQSATPDFTLAIQHFEILRNPDLAVLLAVYLPWLEVTAAITLFVKRLALGAATAVTVMSVVFLGAIGSAWARGLDISCGCFGKDEVSIPYSSMMLRDGILLAAAVVLLVWEARRNRALIPNSKAESLS